MSGNRFASAMDDVMSNNESNLGAKAVPTFKVVIVGDCSVGKTSLLKRYIEDTFQHGENATLGS